MILDASTQLHRAPEIDLTLESNGEVTVRLPGGVVRLGAHGLALLDAFNPTTTVGSAINTVKARLPGTASLDDFINDIRILVASGVLRPGQTDTVYSQHVHPLGLYDSPGLQISMLDDRVRRTAFLNAVAETVHPGDVVLDLGTGSGIMAVAAVKAGARHVYAVEPSRIAGAARGVFGNAGLAEKITLIEGWIQNVSLPERVDVMSFDLLGFEALDMALPEVVRDARERLLKSDARVIPQSLKMYLCPVIIPDEIWSAHVVTSGRTDLWQECYGIDFTSLRPVRPTTLSFFLSPGTAASLSRIGAPRKLFDLDLENGSVEIASSVVEFPDAPSTACFGVMGFFEAQLGPTARFATDPVHAGRSPHWMVPVWCFVDVSEDPVPVPPCRFDYLGRGSVKVTFEGTNIGGICV